MPTITYTVKDTAGATATSTLILTVTPVADITADSITTSSTAPITFNPLTGTNGATADAFENPAAAITAVGSPAHGTVSLNPDGTISYTPTPGYVGPDSFTYTVTSNGVTETATITVGVTNAAPVANPDTGSIAEDSTLTVAASPTTGLLANDTDTDLGDSKVVSQFVVNGVTVLVDPATGGSSTIAGIGSISINADGSYSFVPAADFNGTVPTITYTVKDTAGATATSTLILTVTAVNDAPKAVADVKTTPEDTLATGNVLTNDSDIDVGTTLNVTQFTIPGVGTFAAGTTATIPGKGSLVINSDGSYTFTPALNFNGALPQITYTITDNSGATNQTATSTLDISVTPVNDPPVAVDDPVTTNEDIPVVLNLVANDTDVDGDTLTVKSINGTAINPGTAQVITVPNGVVNVSAAGVVTFTPNPNYNGPATFDYVVQDGKGGEDTGTVNITVTAVNDPPVAVDDPVTTNEDAPVVLNLAGNDTDVDGDTLTVKSINGTAITPGTAQVITVPNGVVNVSAVGVVTFTPNPNYNGPATFDYVVQDGKGGEDTGTVNITVTAVNDPPVATPATPSGNEDTPILVNLAGTDLDGTITSVTVASLPSAAQGILTKADGTPVVAGAPLTPAEAAGLIFKPAPNFNGVVDAITFTVTDNQGAVSLPATVDITIAPVNDAPVALNASINTLEDIPANVNLAGTDIDGTIATVKVTALPTAAQGVLYLADGVTPVTTAMNLTATEAASLKFVPTLNFNGLVNIPFTVIDDLGLPAAAPGNFLIDVADVNDAPIATPTTVTGTEDTPTPVNLTGTDVDGTVTKVTVTGLPPATEGILYLADGVTPVIAGQALTTAQAASLVFKPAPNFNGKVTIPFTVTDNSNELSTPADLIINIGAVNDAPIAAPDLQVVNEDTVATGNVLANDSDIESSPLSVTQFVISGVGTFAAGTTATIPNVGTVTIAANGDYTFTPALNFNGAVPQITYTVSDGVNASNTTLDLTVTAVNDPPVAFPVLPTGNEDTPIVVNLTGSDIDGTVTSVSVTALPPATKGILYLADCVTPVVANVPLTPAQAAGLVFKPALNFNGAVTIPFNVTDNQGLTSAPANADITVNPVNDPPIATPVAPSGNEDTPIPVNLTGSDVDGAIASVTVTSLPPATQGILTKADGTPVVAGVALTPVEAAGLIFVPAPNFNGVVNIPFTVTDNLGAISTPANANITVNAVNDPPVAISDSANTPEDTNVAVTLMGTDVDGTIATVTVTTLPLTSQGILTKADGSPVFAGVPLTPAEAAGLIFTPALNFNGIVNIQFIATDNTGAPSTPANFTIDVGAVNDDPIATPATVIGAEDTSIPVTLTGTDTEDGTVTSISVVTLPPASQGILYLADGVTPVVAGVDYPAGGFIFKPAPNFNGSVAIPFTVKDSQGQVSSPPANVNINIGAENDPPVAIPSAASGNEDTPIPVSLTGTDIDGTVAGVTVTTLPLATQGVLTLANGTPVAAGAVLTPAQAASLIFVPAHNFVGTVNILFTVTDNGGATSAPVTTMIDVKDVVSPPTATPINAVGSSEDKISLSLTGADVDGTIASITIKALPPASQGILTLADGSPVVAGVALTSAQAAGLIFKPNPAFNGTATILFTVTDDEGLESPTASATVKVTAVGNQFEDLIPKNGPYIPYPTLPIATPVLPIGMPENLFVIHSVRESQNVVAQNSGLGVFNADAPTLAELNNFTFDLKGLPIGMDPNLFVQHAVRGVPVVFEPNLFVQNAVRQSQLESTARNIGVTSFNSATNAVTSLMAPFDLGAPNQDVNDFAVDGVKGEFVAASLVNVPETNKQAASGRVGLEKMISQVDALAKPVASDSLTEKTSLEASKNMQVNKKVAAASFANQLNAAAKRFKANTFIAKN
ncbi:MAG: Ig-like domain-containing protein [Methylotenera sp.]